MSNKDFETWWHREGSQPPRENEDLKEFTERIAKMAWENGAYKNDNFISVDTGSEDGDHSIFLSKWQPPTTQEEYDKHRVRVCQCKSGTPTTFIGCRTICDSCRLEVIDGF